MAFFLRGLVDLGDALKLLVASPRPLTAGERERLIALVSFVVKARSPVERDGYKREVELVPEPEAPTRLAKVLARMLAGLDAIGTERGLAWRVVAKAGLDCVPKLRLQVVDCSSVKPSCPRRRWPSGSTTQPRPRSGRSRTSPLTRSPAGLPAAKGPRIMAAHRAGR